MKKKIVALVVVFLCVVSLASCGSAGPAGEGTEDRGGEANMIVSIGGTEVSVAWEKNEAVAALEAMVASSPVTIEATMYGGFEQVGSLGATLPRADVRTTTKAGDIVLYAGDQLVVFYGSNTWSYTRLGKIIDKNEAEMTALLGNGDVSITIRQGGKE